MITKDQLYAITERIQEKVWRNGNVMFEDGVEDAIDILSSLHNLLWECVTGERYNYAFHWCNKCGSDTDDAYFDDLLK